MEENKTQEKQQPTYEQLQKQVLNLTEQLKRAYQAIEEANMYNTYKRLDYCFKVVEFASAFDTDFVDYCTKDIRDIMFVNNTEE